MLLSENDRKKAEATIKEMEGILARHCGRSSNKMCAMCSNAASAIKTHKLLFEAGAYGPINTEHNEWPDTIDDGN